MAHRGAVVLEHHLLGHTLHHFLGQYFAALEADGRDQQQMAQARDSVKALLVRKFGYWYFLYDRGTPTPSMPYGEPYEFEVGGKTYIASCASPTDFPIFYI